jgi:hypothetical protein
MVLCGGIGTGRGAAGAVEVWLPGRHPPGPRRQLISDLGYPTAGTAAPQVRRLWPPPAVASSCPARSRSTDAEPEAGSGADLLDPDLLEADMRKGRVAREPQAGAEQDRHDVDAQLVNQSRVE